MNKKFRNRWFRSLSFCATLGFLGLALPICAQESQVSDDDSFFAAPELAAPEEVPTPLAEEPLPDMTVPAQEDVFQTMLERATSNTQNAAAEPSAVADTVPTLGQNRSVPFELRTLNTARGVYHQSFHNWRAEADTIQAVHKGTISADPNANEVSASRPDTEGEIAQATPVKSGSDLGLTPLADSTPKTFSSTPSSTSSSGINRDTLLNRDPSAPFAGRIEAPVIAPQQPSQDMTQPVGGQEEETPLLANLDPSDIPATDALTTLPIGEGFDATISANSQGKLIELGIEQKNADGTPMLDSNGRPVIIPLRRGMTVHAGDVLGKQFNQEFIARKEAAQRQLVVAEKEAQKTLEVEVAELAALVAKSELDRVRKANKDMPGAIAEEDEIKRVYEYNRSYKSWEKANYDLGIKADEVEVRKAEISIADAQLEERKLISPIDGQIDDIYQNEGQWLREGDNVFRIIRLDKINVEARFDASKTTPDQIQGKRATVYAKRPNGSKDEERVFEGVVTYARPIIEHNRFAAYIEAQNEQLSDGNWYLIPGMHVQIVVHP